MYSLLAFAVLLAAAAANPQNEAELAQSVDGDAVEVADRRGADMKGYQNDYYYTRYGLQWAPGRMTSWYLTNKAAYDKMVNDLAQCQNERAELLLSPAVEDVQMEIRPPTKLAELCSLKADSGPCLPYQYYQRYYFNTETASCERFSYTGCGGNANNFMAKDQCEKTCACYLPKDSGPCRGVKAQWYHNSSTGECEIFFYSGCGGNNNRFLTKSACEAAC